MPLPALLFRRVTGEQYERTRREQEMELGEALDALSTQENEHRRYATREDEGEESADNGEHRQHQTD